MNNAEIRSGYIPVGVDHQIYFEDIGNIQHEPLLFLHGGPGLGCEEKHRSLFNLNKYRVILLHQRGSGKSQTQGEIHDNTTQHIVRDIEVLRKRLKIEKFSLLGSSWGAVPATLYASENTQRINWLILKSPFLARQKDFQWSYNKEGIAKQLQWDWEVFSFKGKHEGIDLVRKYYAAVIQGDAKGDEFADYICRWLNWEGAQYFFHRPHEKVDFTAATLNPYWTNVAKIQIHYAMNRYFLKEDGIIPALEKIAAAQNIFGLCIQGGKDYVTPATEIVDLRNAWPAVELKYLRDADHKIPDEEMLNL